MIKQRRFSRDLASGRDSEIGAYPPFSTGLSRNYFRFVGKPEVRRLAQIRRSGCQLGNLSVRMRFALVRFSDH